jgi:glycosyltransferase involved in cell wall biosynthesis
MRDLLIISQGYYSFLKDPIEIMSNHFSEINVLVRHNPISEISNILPIHYLKSFTKKSLIDLTNKPPNINVITTPVYYIPTDSQYKKLGEKHFKVVAATLQTKNIKNIDLIHSHFIWSSGYVGRRLKDKYNIPLVVTAHGFDVYDLPFKDEDWKEKIETILNGTDCIITVSNSNLECLKKLNINTPIKIIPNGFREDMFYHMDMNQCRRKIGLPLDRKIILTIGHLLEIKNHSLLIAAVNEIIKQRKDILCIILGSGKLKNSLENQIKKSGLTNYIKIMGEKPHNEIPFWINACDIFVLPSLNEGNPTVMFECLGCGKPFIGTKVGGIPEIMTSEDYGFLVGIFDSKEVAEKIIMALDKEWNYNIIKGYAQNFTWQNISKDILKTYIMIHK